MRFTIGTITQSHQLIIEILVPYSNSSIAIDNVHLIDCFPGNYYSYIATNFSYMWAILKNTMFSKILIFKFYCIYLFDEINCKKLFLFP